MRESQNASFLATPSDPYYTYSAISNRDYQWAINDTMSMQLAWSTVRGTAYLAHLDNGIQTLPAVHEDLTQPFRRFKFNVAGGEDVDEHPELAFLAAGGHGTHTAGIMAGATSQSSVPSGYPNPAPAVGGAGACWYCSLLVAKVSRIVGGSPHIDDIADVPAAIYWAVSSGAQVVNISFGGVDHNCTAFPSDAYCAALSSAAAKAVVVVASAGNSDKFNNPPGSGLSLGTQLDFPASNANTIAVGAAQWYTTAGTTGRINLWTEENPLLGFVGSSIGDGMQFRGVLAPGREILSTFYENHDWNFAARCGTSASFGIAGPGTTRGPKYGICTGTSMASPHITGIVGLMRTVNPLLDAIQIRTALLSAGGNAASPNITRGYGLPNANTAVNNVLVTTNRLTPLFSHYSSVAQDHFYSVVPQMARASVASSLLPYAVVPTQYLPYGTVVNVYTAFSDPATVGYIAPKAQMWVFTTHTNPASSSVELLPLYRLSWKCGDPGISICSSNPYHVSHFYTTILSEAQAFIGSASYQFDGIEGYVYPASQGQPAATTRLIRAYNATRDDYAVFPDSEQATMTSQGYTAGTTYLGYVYQNSGNRPTY